MTRPTSKEALPSKDETARGEKLSVHLVDGTYELFRAFYGAPGKEIDGQEIAATRAFLSSMISLLESGATHVAVAFDTVIESFRNQLFDGYKTGAGIDPSLLSQFPLAEEASRVLGLVTWSMIDFEADDAMASFAITAEKDPAVDRVYLCSPDKDLGQCVRGDRIVLSDRRREVDYDEEAILNKFGVLPKSIPDFLALVGDTADGIPGIPKWGEKSAAAVLSQYPRLEDIPENVGEWKVAPRGKDLLSKNLNERRKDALLYRTLATLRFDVPLKESVDDLKWSGTDFVALASFCERIGSKTGAARAEKLWKKRSTG